MNIKLSVIPCFHGDMFIQSMKNDMKSGHIMLIAEKKVLAKNLPWDDNKVPKVKAVGIAGCHVEVDESPAQFRPPCVKVITKDSDDKLYIILNTILY